MRLQSFAAVAPLVASAALLLVVCLVVLLTTAPAWAQHKGALKSPAPQSSALILLRYTPPEGSQWVYEEETSLVEEQSFLGIGGNSSTTVTVTRRVPLRYRVLRSADTLVVQEQVDSIGIAIKLDGTVWVDSALVSSSGGIVTTYALSPSGRLLQKTEDIHDTNFATSPGPTSGYARFALWSQTPPLFVPLPDTPVAIGQRWEAETLDTMASGHRVSYVRCTNTLEALVDTLGKRCARIRISIDSLGWHSATPQEGIGTIIAQGSGQGSAIAYVELATGMPVSVVRELHVEKTVQAAGAVEFLASASTSATLSIRRR